MLHNYCTFCKYTHGKIHADFNYIMNYDVIAIIDNNDGRSVTNDIEYVLWSIKENYKTLIVLPDFNLSNFKIIYKDSQGIWDGIKLNKKGDSASFYSLGDPQITDINEAFAKVSEKAIPL